MSRDTKICKNFDYLNAKFKDLPYASKSEYSIGGIVIDTFNGFSTFQIERYLEGVAKDIMVYLGLPMLTPTVTVNMVEDSDKTEIAGTFNGDITRCHINLNISPIYTPVNIYAVLSHECTHYFLKFHHAEYEDRDENEILTDCAAVYLGLGRYLEKGYQPISVGDGKSRKIGYITSNEVHSLRQRRPVPSTDLPDYKYTPIGTVIKEDPHSSASHGPKIKRPKAAKKLVDEKKKSKRFGIILGIVLILAFSMPVGYITYTNLGGNRVEAPYSAEMKNGDRAYVYITSSRPRYALMNGSIITENICEASTKDGGTVYLIVPSDHEKFMQGLSGSKKVADESYLFHGSYISKFYRYTFDNPVRINGQVKAANKYKQLEGQIFTKTVLKVNKDNAENP